MRAGKYQMRQEHALQNTGNAPEQTSERKALSVSPVLKISSTLTAGQSPAGSRNKKPMYNI
jgi:hypothetical protein